MTKWIKNDSGSTKTWVGQQITNGSYYQIQSNEEWQWSSSSSLLTDIGNKDAIVAKDDSGNTDITDINEAINYLKSALASEVIIQEENTKTGGHFQEQGFLIDVATSDTIKTVDVSFPFPVSLLSATYQNKADFAGDEIEFIVAPDATTGTITAAVSNTDTVITVSQTVIDNAAIGYYIKITDGTNTDDLGRILEIDKVNLTITVETAATQAFTVSSPTTYVKQSIKMMPKSPLDVSGPMSSGESKIGGSYVPANTTLRAIYYNNDAQAKKLVFFIEYLY